MRISVAVTSLFVLVSGAAGQVAPAPVVAEHDNAIFHYARFELDGARPRGRFEGTWDNEGWVGTDFNRLWWRTRGEVVGSTVGDAEGQLAFGRSLGSFFDVLAGYRRIVRPGGGDYLMLGIKGLAPYRFEVGLDLFVADRGRLSARTDVAYELLWSQRIISRPSLSVDWFAAPDVALGQQAGIGDSEFRLPTRFEFSRRFAPYFEFRRTHRSGTRGDGAGPSGTANPWTVRAGLWLVY